MIVDTFKSSKAQSCRHVRWDFLHTGDILADDIPDTTNNSQRFQRESNPDYVTLWNSSSLILFDFSEIQWLAFGIMIRASLSNVHDNNWTISSLQIWNSSQACENKPNTYPKSGIHQKLISVIGYYSNVHFWTTNKKCGFLRCSCNQ